ncbi:hypothetical protein [Streptomyces achromogenes]|uniref:hypothetical protein n=1 Tax=Streptomyces achromogenes TaxID=67255 RepID=UPI0033E0F6EC
MGDRLAAVDQRMLNAYQLEMTAAWPRLWLLLPARARTDLRAAQSYAELAESAVDLYARRPARAPGLRRDSGAGLTQATGRRITSLLRKKA